MRATARYVSAHNISKPLGRTFVVKELLTLYPQGYALIEYPTLQEARAAIDGANDTKLLDQTVNVDFAFVRPPPNAGKNGAGGGGPGNRGRGGGGRRQRSRSRSPGGGRDRDD